MSGRQYKGCRRFTPSPAPRFFAWNPPIEHRIWYGVIEDVFYST
jgi:hypothetical protein